jgi:hypothetical protein
MPGSKKVAGETLPPPLKPPQPLAVKATAASSANSTFLFEFTCGLYLPRIQYSNRINSMFWTRSARWQFIAALISAVCMALPAQASTDLLEEARREYHLTRSNHLAHITNTVAAWKFARACFDLAEFATNDTQR